MTKQSANHKGDKSSGDVYLLQQLQLHQAELEMQNDELRLANEQLELQQLKFAGIYDLAPIGYFILDPEGIVNEVNNAGMNMLGTTKHRILNKRLHSFLSPEYADRYHFFFRDLIRTKTKQSCLLKLLTENASEVYVQVEGIAISPADAMPLQCDIAMIDVTERVNADKNLIKTKERLELALEASASGTWELEPNTMTFHLDDTNFQIFAIENKEFDDKYQTFINMVHPDDRTRVDQHFRKSLNQQSEIDVVCRFLNYAGSECFASIRGHIIHEENQPDRFIGIMMDITEKRRIEQESAQLKHDQQTAIALATLAAEENERKRISDALHDGVSQLLYGIRIRLSALQTEDNLPEVNGVNALLDAVIDETRNLSFQLAPAILTDFGLGATLEELCTRLSTEHMTITGKLSGFARRFSLDIEICIFRIIQELVNNAMKHSGASRIAIDVHKNKLIEINVTDNGRGFPRTAPQQVPTGAGLTSIRNRVNLYNGTLKIESNAGSGTSVTATLSYLRTDKADSI
ncbi:PAS domain S-box protein [Mucilaginibacter achroorhodeus]|uniref:Oxygen sensor histidine kinase NreB n=1 Tax=Mucilaginibacter achroorhodeus TaxID=2599294 RepID=A0A563U6K3_9SPHI|nr:PAS domain-containing protein [Mucilaginibacter achroorhodeus]TWR26986.1 PAS domain S-box protein [Mucilaginibacter achroorhodeus]